MFNLFKSTTPTQSTIVNTPLPINQPVKPITPVMSTPSPLASNIVKTPTVAPKPVTQPAQNLVGGNIPAQYMTPQLQSYLSGLSGTSSTIQAPQTPVASPYVNTNPQGVQLDINGEALLPGGTPLSINPLNANGAIPSTKIGTTSTSDVLSTRNYLENLQKQIMATLTQSPTALQAQSDLKNVQQQQLEGRAQTEAEIDRLMSTANLTREQASGFLTETNRRAQMAQTQLALQQSALSNVVSNDQAQRQASMDAFKLLYGMNQPQSIGGNLVNPITGEVVYSAPQEPGEGFSLSAGQTRYDAQGNVIAQAAPDTSSGLTPYQQFQATQAIANQTARNTDAAKELQRQSGILTETWNRYARGEAKDLNATSQAIVTTFNKILDPTSVVREAEYDRSAQGQALLSTISGKIAAVQQGGPGLTPASLKELVDLGNLYAQNAQASVQAANQRAVQMAQQFGLNPSFVTTPGAGVETRVGKDGTTYYKVPGGWTDEPPKQSFNSVGGDTNQASKGIVAGYDIKSYATDPTHEVKVANIYSKIPSVTGSSDIDKYIKSIAPKSPITGNMVMKAASKYNVDPKMMLAIMMQDSTLGTKGLATKTFNPGNVGNTDTGATVNYGSWDKGVEAVAKNLSWRKVNNLS